MDDVCRSAAGMDAIWSGSRSAAGNPTGDCWFAIIAFANLLG
jgi:hypothetical protein